MDSHAIAQFAKRCTGITSFNISQCENVADSAVGIIKALQGHIEFELGHTAQVTDYSLLAISEAELVPGLKSLNLEATEVTDTGITWLAERCTSLLNNSYSMWERVIWWGEGH